MKIYKTVSMDWDEEEIETINSFREFLQEKRDTVQYDFPALANLLDAIDTDLYNVLHDSDLQAENFSVKRE